MPQIIGDNIDRLCAIEMRTAEVDGGIPRGVLQPLFAAAREAAGAPMSYLAAQGLIDNVSAGDRVLVLCGSGSPPYPAIRRDRRTARGRSCGPGARPGVGRETDPDFRSAHDGPEPGIVHRCGVGSSSRRDLRSAPPQRPRDCLPLWHGSPDRDRGALRRARADRRHHGRTNRTQRRGHLSLDHRNTEKVQRSVWRTISSPRSPGSGESSRSASATAATRSASGTSTNRQRQSSRRHMPSPSQRPTSSSVPRSQTGAATALPRCSAISSGIQTSSRTPIPSTGCSPGRSSGARPTASSPAQRCTSTAPPGRPSRPSSRCSASWLPTGSKRCVERSNHRGPRMGGFDTLGENQRPLPDRWRPRCSPLIG